MMSTYFYITKEFFPINIKNETIGYSRIFSEVLKKYVEEKNNKNIDLNQFNNKFIPKILEHWNSYDNDFEFSSFDIINFLNILSNRSYIDLFQYPVFPLLFFYDKSENNNFISIPRDFKNHIGFQLISEKSKVRANLIINTYKDLEREIEENTDENEDESTAYYFNTHYSNIVYTSNYLIRFFPYCFLSIELQGDGFDNPNRLFFSIENSFYNMSYIKGDLRELIPEFYYFPEMFLNINKINFHERQNNKLVDDVEIPYNINDICNNSNNINNNNNNNTNEKDINCLPFKFIEKMRNLLESNANNIINWINLIFGTKSKYKNNDEKGQYFRPESYIDFTLEKQNEFDKYLKDKNVMLSVDFGLIPIQIIFNKEILNN